jgi:hypothetical protein
VSFEVDNLYKPLSQRGQQLSESCESWTGRRVSRGLGGYDPLKIAARTCSCSATRKWQDGRPFYDIAFLIRQEESRLNADVQILDRMADVGNLGDDVSSCREMRLLLEGFGKALLVVDGLEYIAKNL